MDITEDQKQYILDTAKRITDLMSIECQFEVRETGADDGQMIHLAIYTQDNASFLIGRDGQTVKDFEHILRAMINKKFYSDGQKAGPSLVLDINDYRKTRMNYLVDVAKQAVGRVRSTQKAEALFPMSAYERRVVHMELAACPDVATESIGEGLQRRIVIKPYTI